MAGFKLADGYVAVSADTGQVGKDLDKIEGRTQGNSTKAGTGVGRRIVSGIGKAIAVGAATTVGVAAAGIGTALTKGFARLNAIDTARAKLTGLGNDAKAVEGIMDNALAAVRGTSFGLGEAATTAAGAVAAGIKPGQELERVLKSVTNSAAASGSSMEDMGAIYNKVASLGKAQNDVLQQVADRGIPIYAALAEQFGVTTEAVFKMASEGKISFEDFEKAMTAASGTVADELGKTIPGSLANMGASFGRIGANILGGVFPKIAPLIQGVTNSLGPVEDAAKTFGSYIADRLNPYLDQLIGYLQGGTAFEDFSVHLTAAWTVVQPLAEALIDLFDATAPLRDAFVEIATAAGPQLADLVQDLIPLLVELVTAITPVTEELGEALLEAVREIAPKLPDLADSLVKIVEAVIPLLPEIVQLAADLLTVLLPAIGPVVDLIILMTGNLGFLLSGLEVVSAWLKGDDGMKVYGDNLRTAQGPFADVVRWGLEMSIGLGRAIREAVARAQEFAVGVGRKVGEVVNFFRDLPGNIRDALGNLGSTLVSSGRSLLDGLIQGIRDGVASAKRVVSGALEDIRGLFPFSPAKEGPFSGRGWVLHSGRSIPKAMAEGMTSGAGEAVEAARSLAARTAAGLGSATPGVGAGAPGSTGAAPLARMTQAPSSSQTVIEQNITVSIDGHDLRSMADVVALFQGLAQANRAQGGQRPAVAGG